MDLSGLGGMDMRDIKAIDFARLLGFESISDTIPGQVDFQDATLGDKLGARIGPEFEPRRVAEGKLTESR